MGVEGQNTDTNGGNNGGNPNPGANGAGQSVVIPDNWREALPEDIRNHDSMKAIVRVEDMAKSFIHGQSLIGADRIPVPSKHATPEDWTNVYKKLGLPETADKYEFELSKDKVYNDEFMKGFRENAHKNGILPQQAKALMSWYEGLEQNFQKQAKDAFDANLTKSKGELQKEWGNAFQPNMAKAEKYLKEQTSPEFMEFVVKAGLSDNPIFVKQMSKLANEFYKEANVQGGENGNNSFSGMDPATAKAKYTQIMNDMNHPYYLSDHPGHKGAAEEMQQLYAAAYPEGN